ncbi:MAG: phage tail assembly protein [Parvibaculum sp.]|nr:phage tail assembly protein [Parvibaculum sp.]
MADFEITLSKPVQHGTESISVLECDEPTLDDLDAFMQGQKTSDIAAVKKLIEKCAKLSPAVVGKIKAADLEMIMDAFAPFLPGNKTAQ